VSNQLKDGGIVGGKVLEVTVNLLKYDRDGSLRPNPKSRTGG
jgi:hypothetical protein